MLGPTSFAVTPFKFQGGAAWTIEKEVSGRKKTYSMQQYLEKPVQALLFNRGERTSFTLWSASIPGLAGSFSVKPFDVIN